MDRRGDEGGVGNLFLLVCGYFIGALIYYALLGGAP